MTLMELPRRSRDAFEAAAVIGTWFALDSILTLVPGIVAEDLEELVRRGLIVEIRRQDVPGYDFAHPLVQESIYAELGAARRRELHQALATKLPIESLSARAYHPGWARRPAIWGRSSCFARLRLRRSARRRTGTLSCIYSEPSPSPRAISPAFAGSSWMRSHGRPAQRASTLPASERWRRWRRWSPTTRRRRRPAPT
jgi:hypothetical protein